MSLGRNAGRKLHNFSQHKWRKRKFRGTLVAFRPGHSPFAAWPFSASDAEPPQMMDNGGPGSIDPDTSQSALNQSSSVAVRIRFAFRLVKTRYIYLIAIIK